MVYGYVALPIEKPLIERPFRLFAGIHDRSDSPCDLSHADTDLDIEHFSHKLIELVQQFIQSLRQGRNRPSKTKNKADFLMRRYIQNHSVVFHDFSKHILQREVH